jgi:hypothetical protein
MDGLLGCLLQGQVRCLFELHCQRIEYDMKNTPLNSLTLSEWYDIMGINPWHGFQLSNAQIPIDSKCNTLTYEQAFGNADRIGRRDLRRAINRAEEVAFNYLKYWPYKRHVEEIIAYPTLGNHALSRRYNVDPMGRWVSLQLPEGHVHSLGYLAQSNPVVSELTYADLDGDNVYETATCTASVPSGTLNTEVAIQFQSGDLGTLSESPFIPTRKVSVVGTTATITFDSWNLVKPVKYQGFNSNAIDPNDYYKGVPNTPFSMARYVEVSRRRTDPTGTTQDTAQAVFIWESEPYPYFSRCCYSLPSLETSDPSGLRYAIARGGVRDSRAGIIYLGDAVYDQDTQTWNGKVDWHTCRTPDRVIVRYEAGSNDNIWKTTIARLAAAEATRPICACATANKELAEWQWDLSRNGGSDEVYSSPQDMTNPIGSRRGQVYAWRMIQQLQRTIGILAG